MLQKRFLGNKLINDVGNCNSYRKIVTLCSLRNVKGKTVRHFQLWNLVSKQVGSFWKFGLFFSIEKVVFLFPAATTCTPVSSCPPPPPPRRRRTCSWRHWPETTSSVTTETSLPVSCLSTAWAWVSTLTIPTSTTSTPTFHRPLWTSIWTTILIFRSTKSTRTRGCPKIMEILIRQSTFHCERENTQITNQLTLKMWVSLLTKINFVLLVY